MTTKTTKPRGSQAKPAGRGAPQPHTKSYTPPTPKKSFKKRAAQAFSRIGNGDV